MLIQKRRCARQRGQGMTEYLIVVALIAVSAIGVYALFGQTLRSQTAGLALEVSGQSAAEAIERSQGRAAAASNTAATRKGLSNFDVGNN
jgi:Tfp pilus assembly protein PilV